nr:phage integrase N-terminal SAM-like domain-containing protein [Actinoplanes awajinensis]
MPLFNLSSLLKGLEGTDWANFIRDWDRTLRAANHPETTRYNYLLAATQLARYLRSPESEYAASGAATDPTVVKKHHVEMFQSWMIETRSARGGRRRGRRRHPAGSTTRCSPRSCRSATATSGCSPAGCRRRRSRGWPTTRCSAPW